MGLLWPIHENFSTGGAKRFGELSIPFAFGRKRRMAPVWLKVLLKVSLAMLVPVFLAYERFDAMALTVLFTKCFGS